MPTNEFASSFWRLAANHLWQSTIFAAVAWLLTLALRNNRAAVRYGIWLAASVKFLIPFAWLAAIGARFEWRAAPAAAAVRIPDMVEQISQPFATSSPMQTVPVGQALPPAFLPILLLAVWLIGIAIGLAYWFRQYRRMRSILRKATPLILNLPIPVLAAPGRMEPGVFGIWKPVLLLPEGIAERLTPEQLESILTHELRHVYRRDNLTAAIHMLVETLFWFHPAAWWIRTRLIEERERACDEGVLRLGSEPHVYAESILKVCEFYLSAPPCAAGVTGGELKKRIEGIMENRFGLKLGFGKRAFLAAAAIVAVAVPLALGVIHAAELPRFEVASVKMLPDTPMFSLSPIRSGGRIHWNTTAALLVLYAYHLQTFQVYGMPKEPSGFYAVDATTDPSATEDQIRLMFQTLLAERFKLVARRETRQALGYALTVGKNGPKIKAVSAGEKAAPLPEWFQSKGDTFSAVIEGKIGATGEGKGITAITGRRVTMAQLAETLEQVVGAFVLDKTALAGNYYFGFKCLQRDTTVDADVPTIFAAVQESLGLKLDKETGPEEMLVIDHIERAPTAN